MDIQKIGLAIDHFLSVAVGYVWGLPLVILLAGSGILLSILLKGIQCRGFLHAIKVLWGQYDKEGHLGEITHFQALSAALSATVGLGNIAGVAVAIRMGGPGATFWMILLGLLGMATKYAECTLSLKYRRIDKDGKVLGGPMQYIVHGLNPSWRFLAVFFALFCMIGAFGIGNLFQVHQTASILNDSFGIPKILIGCVVAITVAIVIIGGIKRIGLVASYLVPFMAGIYVLACLCVIFVHIHEVPSLFAQILSDAFTGTAAVGGFTGATFSQVLTQGARRACFSNEAGLGTAPFAHAAATTKEPARQGIVALLEPFIDTVVICTMTALVILLSGAWTLDREGIQLTAHAFNSALPGFGSFGLPVIVALFAYSTSLSWAYYGEMATSFLLDRSTHKKTYLMLYKIVFCVVIVLGSVWSLDAVLSFSDLTIGLMAIPNLIAVWLLFPQLKTITEDYFKKIHKERK